MSTPSRFRIFSLATGLMPWLLSLAIRLLARTLNLPESLLHTTGALVFAQVVAVETRVGRTLRPTRWLRRLQTWLGP